MQQKEAIMTTSSTTYKYTKPVSIEEEERLLEKYRQSKDLNDILPLIKPMYQYILRAVSKFKYEIDGYEKEDLIQELFLLVIKNAERCIDSKGERTTRFSSYFTDKALMCHLYRIFKYSTRECRHPWNRVGFEDLNVNDDHYEDEAIPFEETLISEDFTTEEAATTLEMREILSEEINKLTPNFQIALVEHYYNGVPRHNLNMSHSVVHYAKERLGANILGRNLEAFLEN